jgi:methionine-gamma-lyase
MMQFRIMSTLTGQDGSESKRTTGDDAQDSRNSLSEKSLGFSTSSVKNRHLDKSIYPHREAIYPTSAYLFPSAEEAMRLFDDKDAGFIYSRWNNPSVESACQSLCALEALGSDQEVHGLLFASGMAAIAACFNAMLKPGQKLLTQSQLYGGTDELIDKMLEPRQIERQRIRPDDWTLWESSLKQQEVAMVYIETPSNPMLDCVDIRRLSQICRAAEVPMVIDNTFSTPYLQQPLQLGADVVVYSTTKFLNGHGSSLGGAVLSNDKQLIRGPIFDQLKLAGAVMSPFDAWLLQNGLKTLSLRMDRHCSNAEQLASYFSQHPKIKAVQYLGLEHMQGYELARSQMRKPSPMISIEVEGGLESAISLMDNLQIAVLATTLGTLDTLIQHPASMTHKPVPKEIRQAAGIEDGLLRLSIGIEDIEDLLADFEQALMNV